MDLNLSILESAYILFMFNYFKTTISIHHPLEGILTSGYNFLKHPIHTGIYENKICNFGNLIGFILPIWFIGRHLLKINKKKLINKIIIILLFVGSIIMNINAFAYLIPIFILEYYIQ